MARDDYTNVVRGSQREVEARKEILALLKTTPIPDDELLANITVYLRSPILAKILYVNELYEQIQKVPGVIMEFGVWWGANLSLFESFRSVYEPYNWTRKVVGFDKNPQTIVALAYFDLALYEPTRQCLETIRPYLVRGSILAMDQLNSAEFPGETIAFREVFGSLPHRLVKSRFLPDRAWLVIE